MAYPHKRVTRASKRNTSHRLRRLERQVAMNKSEKKYIHTNMTVQNPNDFAVTEIPQGIGNSGRIGTEAYFKRLEWQFSIPNDVTPEPNSIDKRQWRLVVYSPKNDPSQTLADNTYQGSLDPVGFNTAIDLEQYNVYRDQTIDAVIDKAVFRGSLSLNKKLSFVGNAATTFESPPIRVAMYAMSQGGTPQSFDLGEVKGWYRMTYCDK